MLLKLKELRLKNGYTVREMAEKLSISTAFYCQIENEKRNLSYKMAFNIANILKTKPDKLFYEEIKEKIEK